MISIIGNLIGSASTRSGTHIQQEYTITSVDTSTPISVENGTPWASLTLPSTATAILDPGGEELTVDVTWDEGSYDPNTADTYVITGTISGLPLYVSNPSNVTASISITVEEARPEPEAIGTILDETFDGTLDDFVVNTGTGTITLSGGNLALAGGNGGFTNSIVYDAAGPYDVMMLEKWKQSVTFVAPTASSTSYGFCVGVKSTNSTSGSMVDSEVWLQLNTGGSGRGAFHVFTHVGGSQVNFQGDGAFKTVNNGGTYTFEVERNKNQYIVKLFGSDGTTQVGSTWTHTTNITSTAASSRFPNTGKFAIWNNGASFNITRWKIESAAQKNVDIVFVGDSNIHGMYAGSNAARYCEDAATDAGMSFEILGGNADTTQEALSYLDLLLELNPKYVYLNTIANNVATSTSYETDYGTLVSTLKSNGITVIHGTPIARNSHNMTTASNWIKSTYASDSIVDLFTITKNPSDTNLNDTYEIGDNAHLNSAGNALCSAALLDVITSLGAPSIQGVPIISGTEVVGNTLTVTPAFVSGEGTITNTYQWKRDGTNISGETGTTYNLVSDDYGTDITVVQTATNSLGSDTAESAISSIPDELGDLDPEAGIQVEKQLGAGSGAPMGFLQYLPDDYEAVSATTYPCIVFLHGAGERGNGTTELNRVDNAGIPKKIADGWNASASGSKFIVLSPQQSTSYNGWIGNPSDDIPNDALEFCLWALNDSGLRIDPTRLYLTGLSMGTPWYAAGFNGSIDSVPYTNIFAAISPVSAGGEYQDGQRCGNRDIPVWGFHGTADSSVPITDGRRPINGFNSVGGTPTPIFTEYTGLGHSSAVWDTRAYATDNTYHTPNLYEWFLTNTL